MVIMIGAMAITVESGKAPLTGTLVIVDNLQGHHGPAIGAQIAALEPYCASGCARLRPRLPIMLRRMYASPRGRNGHEEESDQRCQAPRAHEFCVERFIRRVKGGPQPRRAWRACYGA